MTVNDIVQCRSHLKTGCIRSNLDGVEEARSCKLCTGELSNLSCGMLQCVLGTFTVGIRCTTEKLGWITTTGGVTSQRLCCIAGIEIFTKTEDLEI